METTSKPITNILLTVVIYLQYVVSFPCHSRPQFLLQLLPAKENSTTTPAAETVTMCSGAKGYQSSRHLLQSCGYVPLHELVSQNHCSDSIHRRTCPLHRNQLLLPPFLMLHFLGSRLLKWRSKIDISDTMPKTVFRVLEALPAKILKIKIKSFFAPGARKIG